MNTDWINIMFSKKTSIIFLAVAIVLAFISAFRHDIVCTLAFVIGGVAFLYIIKNPIGD